MSEMMVGWGGGRRRVEDPAKINIPDLLGEKMYKSEHCLLANS